MVWTRRALLAGVGSMIAGGAYAGLIEPYWRLQATRYRVTPPGWPANQKLLIAALGDPHINRPFVTPSHMKRVTSAIMAAEPDLIVLLGDYLSSIRFTENSVTHAEVAACFEGLRAPLGVHAILGNHDWWDDPEQIFGQQFWPPSIAREMMSLGINVMENNALPLEHNGQKFWLLGLGDQWAEPKGKRGFLGRDDLSGTLAQMDDDAPAILLAHEPDIFPNVPKRVALTLCGHTHGGQIVFGGFAPVVPSRFGRRYRYGHIIEDNRHLIVTSGIGMGGLPLRFGMPPEVVFVELGFGQQP